MPTVCSRPSIDQHCTHTPPRSYTTATQSLPAIFVDLHRYHLRAARLLLLQSRAAVTPELVGTEHHVRAQEMLHRAHADWRIALHSTQAARRASHVAEWVGAALCTRGVAPLGRALLAWRCQAAPKRRAREGRAAPERLVFLAGWHRTPKHCAPADGFPIRACGLTAVGAQSAREALITQHLSEANVELSPPEMRARHVRVPRTTSM